MLLRLTILILSFFYVNTAIAQSPVFRNYNNRSGLPSNETFQVKQDSKGYIWISTNSGMCRFDGYEFRNFEIKDGLPDNTVFDIYEDYKGRVWFLPLSNKLSYFFEDSIYPYSYNEKFLAEANSSALITKQSFRVDSADNLTFGMKGKGVFHITNSGKITRSFDSPAENTNYIIDENKQVYFVSTCTKSRTTTLCRGERPVLLNGVLTPNSDDVQYIFKKRNGNIVYAGYNTIYEIAGYDNFKTFQVPTRIIWMHIQQNGDIWYGTYKEGAFCLKNGDFNSRPLWSLLPGLSVTSVLIDREGGLWFTTLENGVYYMPSLLLTTYTTDDGLSDDNVLALAADSAGQIVIGLYCPKINQLTTGGIKVIEIGKNPNLITNCLLADGGEMYIGTNSMVCKLGKDILYGPEKFYTIKSKYVSGSVLSMVKCSDGLWLGSSFSVNKSDGDTLVYLSAQAGYSLRGLSLLQNKDGSMWIGSPNGLWMKKDTAYTDFGNKNALFKTRINCIKRFDENTICLATKGMGLIIWDTDKNIVHRLTCNDGLTSNSLTCLFVDSNIVWVGTETGLNKITVVAMEENQFKIECFTANNGLASNDINDILVVGDNVYVATAIGLTKFNYKKVKPNKIPPPIYITGFKVNDRNYKISQAVELDYDQNFIAIEFIGLSYRKAGKMNYRYKIIGINDDWLYTVNTSVQYPYLPDGDFRFIAEAQNEDGVWSSQPASIKLVIHPPFWKTLWFYIICFVALIIMIYVFIKSRERRLIREKEVLEVKVTERTAEVVRQKEEIQEQAVELAKLSIVARETNNAVMIMDAQGNFEWVNEGFVRMYGYSLEHLLQLKGRNIIDASGNKNVENLLQSLYESKQSAIYESLNDTRDGEKIWAQTTITPILDAIGNIVKLVAIDSNINKLKLAEEEIMQQKEEIETQRDELAVQKLIVDEKNKDITDSINYAKRIQNAILPSAKIAGEMLGDHFVVYLPKDIVSGDLYWIDQKEEKTFFAAVDCTGHGVPGAFMSIVGYNGLYRSVNEFGKTKASEILDTLNTIIDETLHLTETGVNDGMDISLCALNRSDMTLDFSGANNPLYIIRKGDNPLRVNNEPCIRSAQNATHCFYLIAGDKQPIGACDYRRQFTNHTIQLQKGDALYVFSDGYVDQFGGDLGRKFKYTRLRELLLELQNLNMPDQALALRKKLDDWKGINDQVDDICIIGIRV